MDRYTFGRTVGFFVLLFSSLTFLSLAMSSADSGLSFSAVVGFVLLIYAWSDYRHFTINAIYGLAMLIGFLVADFEGILYAFPLGIAYLIFIYLMRANREKPATLLFAVSLPLALVNSYILPQSSLVAWTMVGLMAGIVENAVIEEMAEGDPIMIALYFMALGPLALIPLALQNVTGKTLFAKENRWPVGPAMFTIAVPLFRPVLEHAGFNLPEWLFYVQYHGVPHAGLGFLAGALTLWGGIGLGLVRTFAEEGMNFVETVAGIMAAAVAFLLALAGLGLVGYYIYNSGYTGFSYVLFLAGLVLLVFVVVKAVRLPRFHYERRSSISWTAWITGTLLLADALSVLLLLRARGVFTDPRPALVTGLVLAVWYYAVFIADVMGDRISGRRELPGAMLSGLSVPYSWLFIASAFIAGLWVGFGIGWIVR